MIAANQVRSCSPSGMLRDPKEGLIADLSTLGRIRPNVIRNRNRGNFEPRRKIDKLERIQAGDRPPLAQIGEYTSVLRLIQTSPKLSTPNRHDSRDGRFVVSVSSWFYKKRPDKWFACGHVDTVCAWRVAAVAVR